MASLFTENVRKIIKMIPYGKVATYGQIAAYAGNQRAARQIVKILHSSKKLKLPWHRIINRRGMISLPYGSGYEIQKQRLIDEGIIFNNNDRIDLKRFLWNPKTIQINLW